MTFVNRRFRRSGPGRGPACQPTTGIFRACARRRRRRCSDGVEAAEDDAARLEVDRGPQRAAVPGRAGLAVEDPQRPADRAGRLLDAARDAGDAAVRQVRRDEHDEGGRLRARTGGRASIVVAIDVRARSTPSCACSTAGSEGAGARSFEPKHPVTAASAVNAMARSRGALFLGSSHARPGLTSPAKNRVACCARER